MKILAINFDKDMLNDTFCITNNSQILKFICDYPLKKENIKNKILFGNNIKNIMEKTYGKGKKINYKNLL